MPRVKKTESSEEEKIKKSTKKSTKKDSKRDNPEEEIVEDELSDVDLDESGKEGATDVKENIKPAKPEKVVTKLNAEILPPKGTPYEELDVVDHLNCIIKFAGETYNQDLRSDALDLKRRITGNVRRPRSRSKNQPMSRGESFVRKTDNFNRSDSNFNRPGFNQRDSRPQNFTEPRQFNRSRPRSNSLTQRRPPMMETPDIYND